VNCPECGSDSDSATDCPVCGANFEWVRQKGHGGGQAEPVSATGSARPRRPASAARTTGSAKRSGSGKRRGRGGVRASARVSSARPVAVKARRNATRLIICCGVAAVVVVAVAVVALHGHRNTSSAPVADTSGTYAQLVARANAQFDQGSPYLEKGALALAEPYFTAAAEEYRAAWALRSSDPAVGSDYATALYYSGKVTSATTVIDAVLALKPTGDVLQKVLFNRGNYLATAGRVAEQRGKTAQATRLLASAKASYRTAIAVDSSSDVAAAARSASVELAQPSAASVGGTPPSSGP